MRQTRVTLTLLSRWFNYDDCAFLPRWPGVPLANEEGRIISEALGSKRSILLAHHGLLTTGA